MENKKEKCPLCPNHCSATALSCEKGQAYFNEPDRSEQAGRYAHSFHGRDGHRKHGHEPHHRVHRDEFENMVPQDSLAGLIMQCGHQVFHSLHNHSGNADMAFAALSDSEKEELRKLLVKTISASNRE